MARTGRVLVVEDEPAIGEAAAAALADEGHEVRWARDGRAGLDLTMPVLDGRGFLAEQRRLAGPAARAPVIVLSGTREARAAAAELGAAAAIAKPFELDDLMTAVARVLDGPPG